MNKRYLCPNFRFLVLLMTCIGSIFSARSQTITTVAGMGGSGYNGDGIAATAAQMFGVLHSVLDGSGNIYVCDYGNRRVRKINTSGTISTIAGTGSYGYSGDGGPATAAQITNPLCLALDAGGNLLIGFMEAIRKIDASGVISTYAGNGSYGYSGDGGDATAASLSSVRSIVIDAGGNIIFSDQGNNCIRKITPSGTITTIAGTGTAGFSGDGGAATAAQLSLPFGLAINGSGELIMTDYGNNRIRKINTSGVIYTIAGIGYYGFAGDGGPATAAQFRAPTGIAIDPGGNIYISDAINQRVRKISTSGIISTKFGTGVIGYNGDGIPASSATLAGPAGIMIDASGNVYVSDYQNDRLRKVNPSGVISTVCGTGHLGFSGDGSAATSAQLFYPRGQAFDGSGNMYIGDGRNFRIRKVNTSGVISTFAGTGGAGHSGDGGPATAAQISNTFSVAVDRSGNVFVSEASYIRKIAPSGTISTISGGGSSTADGIPATAASIDASCLAVDTNGNIYFCEENFNNIRKIDTSGIIFTVAGTGTAGFSGDGSAASAATLNYPWGLYIDRAGNLYFSDVNNYRIRKINASGIISTLAGTGSSTYSGDGGAATAAGLGPSYGVTGDNNGNIFLSNWFNQRVRKIDTSGTISAIAGTGVASYTGDGGAATAAGLNEPQGITCDAGGNVFIAEYYNNVIRRVDLCPLATAGSITGPSTVCAGATITLVDTSGSGSWSSIDTTIAIISSSGLVTGISAGSVTISYTVTNSCGIALATFTLSVGSLPVAGTITGLSVVCVGASISLTDTTGSGTWSSGSTSVGTVSSTGVVTGVSAGSATISYSVTNSCGTTIATHTIAVATAPNAGIITGLSTVCAGSSITLSDTTGSGTWSSSASSVATTSSTGVVTGVTTGTTTISYSVSNSCGTAVATHTITVNSLPNAGTVTGISVLCVGSTNPLTDTSTGGSWSSSASGIATVNSSGFVTGVSAGNATVSYTVSNSCGTAVATRLVSVNPLPYAGVITGTDTLCPGQTATLTDTVTAGFWSTTNAAIALVSSSGVVSGVSPGTVTIRYTVTNACGMDTAIFSITVRNPALCPDAIKSIDEKQSFVISPNPNNGTFTISIQASFIEHVPVIVTNLLGQKVKELIVTTNTPSEVRLNEPAGIYFVTMLMQNGAVMQKLIKSD